MKYDIIIVGGGMVGSLLACALAQQTTLSIAILESQSEYESWVTEKYHHRVSAIALSSQRIFQRIGIWEAMKKRRVSPFTEIAVWDGVGAGEIHFDCQEVAESNLGYIIENNVIQAALLEKIKQYPTIEFIAPVKLASYHEIDDDVQLTTTDGKIFQAKLAIAADGARSWLREAVGIEVKRHAYDQEAIVATVTTALPHQKIARQVFLPEGPLAFLPLLPPNVSSIVWSLPVAKAKQLLAEDKKTFAHELASAFSHRLGEVVEVDERFSFPLHKQQAKNYMKSRVVLVGDAAHAVHPLAGQGVNLGFLDAASLVDIIVEAEKNQRDFSAHSTLRRYERWRKADNLTMMCGIDAIKNLFASDKKSIQTLRSYGLQITNKLNPIKNQFTRHAVGAREGLPSLAKINNS